MLPEGEISPPEQLKKQFDWSKHKKNVTSQIEERKYS